jgi:hypothetical protein
MKSFIRLSLVFFALLVSNEIYAVDYFWVGGTGSWTDVSHWATTSGGSTKRTVAPTLNDDVYFDANSFLVADQTVTITSGAVCRSMNWTGVTNNPEIHSFFDDIDIYGSLIIPSTVIRSFTGNVHFKGASGSFNIDLDNLPLATSNNKAIYFEGAGTWTLQDDLTIYGINISAGTFNTNGKTVTANQFIVSGAGSKSVFLGASSLVLSSWDVQSATGLTFNAGTSSIACDYLFSGQSLTYNNLIVADNSFSDVSLTGNNTFNTITLNQGSTTAFAAGSTQTFTTLTSGGTLADPVIIKSTTSGVAATLSKNSGTVIISFARIQDNTATGGATFAANNSVDLGNVTGWTIPVIQPTVQSSSIFSMVTVINSVELKWTKGDGGKRVVVARPTSAVNVNPADGASYVSAAYGTVSNNLGSSNYVVYSGNEDHAVITGLTAGTVYHFKIYEFNGSGASTDYFITSPPTFSLTTLPSTAVVISNSPVSVCAGNYYPAGGSAGYNDNENFTQTLSSSTPGNKVRLTFTDFFTNEGDVLSIYDGADTSAPLVGSYTGSSSPGTITATNATGKLTIHFESNAFVSSTGWLATITCTALDSQPTVAPSSVYFQDVTSTSMTIGWTNGNGGKRIVVARQATAVTAIPTDGNDYTANSVYGSGTEFGTGDFVVYNGTGNQVNVTGLSLGTTYYFSVFEYKGANTSVNYLSTAATGNQTTLSLAPEPTLGATNFGNSPARNSATISWTNGNGARRLVIATTGSGTFQYPVDGTTYTADAAFGSGDPLGEIGYVVYDGTGSTATITNLEPGTYYTIYIIEYNGSAFLTNYRIDGNSYAVETIRYKPTIQTTHLTVSKITTSSVKLSWTRGDGNYTVVVGHEGSAPAPIEDLSDVYSYGGVYGQGWDLGAAGTVVYQGGGESVDVTGLNSETTYYFVAYEMNQVSEDNKSNNYFLTVGAPVKSITTLAGKTFYWVGGSGNWSEFATHWATTSGGSVFHAALPTSSDDVIFDANSFSQNDQTVIVDTLQAYCRNIDWSGISESVNLKVSGEESGRRCGTSLYIFGSVTLSDHLQSEIPTMVFSSTRKGNTVDLRGELRQGWCGFAVLFNGYGGEWTLKQSFKGSQFNLYSGKVIAPELNIEAYNVYVVNRGVLDLGHGKIMGGNVYSMASSTLTADYFICNTYGGSVNVSGTHFKKIQSSTGGDFRILDGGSFDTLQIISGSKIYFESGKTFDIKDIVVAPGTYKFSYIRSTTRGTGATIRKTSGAITIKDVYLEDNTASGGAVFTANTSVAVNNVSGWKISEPVIFAPATIGYYPIFPKVLKKEMEMKVYVGEGTGRLVVARAGAPVDKSPESNVFYDANKKFGLGSDLGGGNFVIYAGKGTKIPLEGLTADTEYFFSIFEYNAWNDSILYAGYTYYPPIKIRTLRDSDITASSTSFTVCDERYFDNGGRGNFLPVDQPITQTFTPATAGTKLGVLFSYNRLQYYDRIYVYDGKTDTAPPLDTLYISEDPSPPIIATNSTGALTFKIVTNYFGPDNDYYQGWEAQFFCAGTAATEPSMPSTALKITERNATSMTLLMTKGNGTGRMVVARKDQAVNRFPFDRAGFTSGQLGEGTNLGNGNFVVYSGPDEAITVTGLEQNAIYHFAALEYNGNGGTTNYLLSNPATAHDTTSFAAPTIPSSIPNISTITATTVYGSFQSGDGLYRLVVMKKGGEITAAPKDGVAYYPGYNFGFGTNLGDSTFAVNEGNGISVIGLKQQTTYYYKVFEFNGTGKKTKYLTSKTLSGTITTGLPSVTFFNTFDTLRFCPGQSAYIYLYFDGKFPNSTRYKLQLSDSLGNYDKGLIIKDTVMGQSTYLDFRIPRKLAPGKSYKLRVLTADPVTVSKTEAKVLIPSQPEVNATLENGTLVSNLETGNQWYRNGFEIPGANLKTYPLMQPGSYSASTFSAGCLVMSDPIVITSTGGEYASNGFGIYPIPASAEVFIENPLKHKVLFSFHDINGQTVNSGELNPGKNRIGISALPTGIYIVQLHTPEKLIVQKFAKH